jgi:hypothetical protein
MILQILLNISEYPGMDQSMPDWMEYVFYAIIIVIILTVSFRIRKTIKRDKNNKKNKNHQ